MKEALFYTKISGDGVQCDLCPHLCKLKDGQSGICKVRKNIKGTLYTLVYGRAIAVHVDPIEKKPLFHVSPGSRSFSIATVGCNFKCTFCQNSSISQVSDRTDVENTGTYIIPEQIVAEAINQGCRSIAYTYTEPTIFFEYAYDTSKLAAAKGLLNLFVSNGYINPEPLNLISPYLDAANIDLKSFNDEFYKKNVGARLHPVLDTLKLMKERNIWLEVTTLIIPSLNDADKDLKDIATFIVNELGAETPWHISRFYPQYKLMHIDATPVSTLERARNIGLRAGLRYVYTGNVTGDAGESTYCYHCGKKLIHRYGFRLLEQHIIDQRCEYCGTPIDGIELG
ncbi:AmmeMemoRadiSam system radical SAM enzyme [candidate division KSB1 bacterium]|nr:AmmeMemoRadiSam system radical SAM enzyme [candidate division KSB1 bacterium]